MKSYNPITTKIYELVASGKTTKEKICVACDLKYPTFDNIFTRNIVSKPTLSALKYNGIIDENDILEYRQWFSQHGKPNKKRKPLSRKYRKNPIKEELVTAK